MWAWRLPQSHYHLTMLGCPSSRICPTTHRKRCPICKEGKLPLVHLGSRKMKQEAKQTL